MIPELHNLSSSSLYAAFFFSGTARGGCCTGCKASGISWMWYFAPGSFPIPSNISLNSDNTYYYWTKRVRFSGWLNKVANWIFA